MSSDEEVLKCPKGKKLILNSDSEEDITIHNIAEKQIFSSDKHNSTISKKEFQRVRREISSDEDITPVIKNITNNVNRKEDLRDNSALKIQNNSFETDSENSSGTKSPKSKTSSSTQSSKLITSTLPTQEFQNRFADKNLYDAECSSDEEKVNQSPTIPENIKTQVNQFSNKDLYDAEGSSDEEKADYSQKIKQTSKKQIRKSAKAAKSEIEEIHRESQRIVRESHISLPYHVPKQRTLAEFLQRRKSTPIISLRKSKDQLNHVWKILEEREKEAFEFYKSESEDDHNQNEKTSVGSIDKIESKPINVITDNHTNDSESFMNSCKAQVIGTSTVERSLINTEELIVKSGLLLNKNDPGDEKVSDKTETNNLNVEINNKHVEAIQSKSYEFHLSEGLTESVAEVSINIETNKFEKASITESQDIELHLSETEHLSEAFQLIDKEIKQNEESLKLAAGNKNISQTDSKMDVNATVKSQDIDSKENIDKEKPILRLKAPVISGEPSEIIDLEENSSAGVNDLMHRFIKHISIKGKHKVPSKQISIVSAEKDLNGQVSDIKEEIVNIIVNEEEEEVEAKLAKPGAKLAKLRERLQAEIGQRREVEWNKKLKDKQFYEEEVFEEFDEKSEFEEIDKDNDDEKETEEDEEEETEEEEEEDFIFENKKKPKNAFVDDEAEESENEENETEDEDGETESFIKRPKEKRTPLKRIASEDIFASQEIFNKNNDDRKDDDEATLIIGQDHEVKNNVEEESKTKGIINALTESPAFPLPSFEHKPLENWASPIFTSPLLKRREDNQQCSPGLEGLCDSPGLSPTQDFMGMCSGKFSSQLIQCKNLETSQEFEDFQLILDDNDTQSQSSFMDFKTGLSNIKDSNVNLNPSDDEEILDTRPKTKNKRKLNFSDDEDSNEEKKSEESTDNEDELNAHNTDENKDIVDDEEGNKANNETENKSDNEDAVEDVDYDSEENEVPREAGQFLDKEAELSESEWDSEDEDEEGLDLLEQEEADKEKIDHDADKEELSKMHLRRMLVEDSKEVKILQEILFDDGDLHSDENGRQRLFRWSNQDAGDEIQKSLVGDSDDEKADDEEEDEHWRRSRHERETFLREHNKKMAAVEVEEDLLVNDSQLFKLGKAALRRIENNSQEHKITIHTDPLTSPDAKRNFLQKGKRGSFLSRGQQVLARLAQITNASSDGPVLNPKNSRNFVFASISPTKESDVEPLQSLGMKRKRTLPLPVPKRPCLTKVDKKLSKKRSLFDQLAKCES